MPIDEARRIRGQKYRRADQFLYRAPAPGRGSFGEPCAEIWICYQRRIQRRVEIARRDGVAIEAILRPIGCHALGQIAHGAFGRCVGGYAWARERGLHRGNIDYFATFSRDHMTGNGLSHMKNRGNIGLQQAFERIRRKIMQLSAVLHAGVVDQNINRTDLRLKAVHSAPHRFVICGIKG